MSIQKRPSSVRRTGNRPLMASAMTSALFAVQNAKQS